jgi:gliding motility-associated-like protein
MRKLHVFLIFTISLLFTNVTNAQCPLGVGITSNPIGAVCRDVPVNYTANPGTAVNPQYVWVVNGDTVSGGGSISNTTPGDVIVYITADNCPDTAFNQVRHEIVYFDVDFEVIIEECNQAVADVQVNGVNSFFGTPPFTYELINGSDNLGQQILYTDLPVGNYPVYITEAGGCSDTTWIAMAVKWCDPPIPSQIMTPNGDGLNDFWYIGNILDYPENEVYIFDRWGQRVYHKKNYDNTDGWEAKYVGGNLPVSTYYYVLEVTQEKSDDIVLKGAISIFR